MQHHVDKLKIAIRKRKQSMKKRVPILLLFALIISSTTVYAQGRGKDCLSGYLTPRLAGGMWARVTLGGTANRVRAEPSLSARQIGSIPPGTPVYVTSAPACADGLVFWQVGFRDIGTPNSDVDDFGWTAEGGNGEYWLEPLYQTWSIPLARQVISAGNLINLRNLGQAQYGMVSRLAWSPDSSKLAINTVGAIWIHDVKTANVNPLMIRPYPADTNTTTALTFTPNNTLLSAGADFFTWDIFSGNMLGSFSLAYPNADPAANKAINAAGTLLALPNADGSIRIMNLQTSADIFTLMGHSLVGTVAFSPNGALIASSGGAGMANSDTTIRIWNAANGTQQSMIDVGAPTYRLAFSPDSNKLAVPYTIPEGDSVRQALQVSDLTTFTILTLQHPQYSFSADAFAFSPDGSTLAVGAPISNAASQTTSGVVLFFDANSGVQQGSLAIAGSPTNISYSPDGTLLAISYADPYFWGPDTVSLWGVTQ